MAHSWVRRLMRAVAGCWTWHSLAERACVQFLRPQKRGDGWEVWVYPAVQEVLGGRHNGKSGWGGFTLDVSKLLEQFPAGRISLNTGNRRRPSELVLEGDFQGKPVRLHLWMRPPAEAAVEE